MQAAPIQSAPVVSVQSSPMASPQSPEQQPQPQQQPAAARGSGKTGTDQFAAACARDGNAAAGDCRLANRVILGPSLSEDPGDL